jgi:hypothetical protein
MKEALHVISSDGSKSMPNAEQYLATNHKEYYLFNLSGGRKKIKVLLSDILLVRAIKGGHADKLLYLKGNIIHTIRGHALEELISITGFLLQCNKQDIVSPDAINYLEEDSVYLNGLTDNGKPILVTLNRTYKEAFLQFFHYPKKG